MKNLKSKIRKGKTVHGCWLNTGSNISAEIVGNSGLDWVLIDLEHGAGDNTAMLQQLQALEASEASPIVRVEELSKPKVQRILDSGAMGIMFPQIQTTEEAEFAASTFYYPPKGTRGMAKMVRSSQFGNNFENYMASLGDQLLCIIQIETIQALENVEEIAAIRDVDVLFVGPSDLTLALGIFNQLEHPEYQKAIKKVAEAAKKHGKTAGVLLFNIDEYEMYHALGYRFLAYGSDGSFIQKSALYAVKMLNEKYNAIKNQK